MGYLGNVPATSFETVRKQVSTTNSGTTITLDFPVTNVQDILVTVDAVVQSYDNYSLSAGGTVLNLGGTLNNNRVEILYVGRTFGSVNAPDNSVTTAQLQNNSVVSSKMFSGFANGITMADQWQITGSPVISADTDTFITADWARSVPSTFNYIGSGMSQSSGVFTFPSTGIYLINFILIAQRTGSTRYFEGRINATTNNSTYTNVGQSTGSINLVGSSGTLANTNMLTFVDVTDTANVKVKFSAIADEAIVATGNPSYPRTSAMFIKLGDT